MVVGGGGDKWTSSGNAPPPRSPNLICAARLNLKIIIKIVMAVSYTSPWNDNAVETKDEAIGKGIGDS